MPSNSPLDAFPSNLPSSEQLGVAEGVECVLKKDSHMSKQTE
jgi:hypothetical protein